MMRQHLLKYHYQYRGGAFNVARSALHVETYTANSSNPRVGIGTSSPDAKVEIISTTEQLRLTHTDASKYTTFTQMVMILQLRTKEAVTT